MINAKNAICHDTTTFFLYFFSDVIFNNLYVKYIVRVVQIRVIIDNINGKIELVSSQIWAAWNVHGIFTEPQSIKVIINITTLQTIHAIKLHNELIKISGKFNFCGQKAIIYNLNNNVLKF